MNNIQRDVTKFHAATDIPIALIGKCAIRRPALRVRLIREETKECCKAIMAGDIIGAIDGMCDALCVIYGTAVEFGIDLDPFWEEVHKTNMANMAKAGGPIRSAGGPTRSDGKKLKPPGWTPPDIARVLDFLGYDVA